MFPLRSQPGDPEKMESERPRVPWLSMHSTSSAGASELRNCPAWLLVGAGIGGGPDEHAATAQPRRMTAAAQMPGCLLCRTYGSLEWIGSTTVTADGAIRFEAKDAVSLAIAAALRRSPRWPVT
jgi:hypothetical protein